MPLDVLPATAGTAKRRRWLRPGPLALAAAMGLMACASPPKPQPDPVPAALPAAAPAPVATPEPPPAPPVAAAEPAPVAMSTLPVPAPVPPTSPSPWLPAATTDLAALLDHAERLRTFTPSELQAHIASLGDPGTQPLRQMQLALALTYTHQPPDTARALGLMQRVINHTAPESAVYKPLARLLASRLLDQRRLEDTVDRQNQQLRDGARRIEQLNERLEAMRAIERSLLPRPAAPAGNGSRPATP